MSERRERLPEPGRQAALFRAREIRRERLRYLEPGRIPFGLVTVLGGYAGLGKSQYTCLLAAGLSRGEYGDPAASVIATAEDSPSTTVRPRLEAVQADLDLVHFIVMQSDDGLEDGIAIPDDLDAVAVRMPGRGKAADRRPARRAPARRDRQSQGSVGEESSRPLVPTRPGARLRRRRLHPPEQGAGDATVAATVRVRGLRRCCA
jgi:AAA domain